MQATSHGLIVGAALLCGLICSATISGCNSARQPKGPPMATALELPRSNAELEALYVADQADRTPETAPADWSLVEKHDLERQTRVRELLDSGAVRTGRDYYHAAMVYQHANGADGVQLAHELAMIGACLGDKDSRWLAAASYDRMLMNLERPQRFGTQYRSDNGGKLKLYVTSDGVTDDMRSALHVPSLREAKEREQQMQAQLDELGKTMTAPKAEHPGN